MIKYVVIFATLFLGLISEVDAIDRKSEDSIEVSIIESFIAPESPGKYKVSFYTSEECESSLILNGKIVSVISSKMSDFHTIEADISKQSFKGTVFTPSVSLKKKDGSIEVHELIEVKLLYDFSEESSSSYFTCLLGGAFFLTPSYNMILIGNEVKHSFTKDLPVFAFYKKVSTYPVGYISAEYSYIDAYQDKNFARMGYNHIIEVPVLEYISPTISGFTNFKGFNGVGAGVTVGMFNISTVFTLYTRARYNFMPGVPGREFTEVSVGLYSSFFSLNF